MKESTSCLNIITPFHRHKIQWNDSVMTEGIDTKNSNKKIVRTDFLSIFVGKI